MSRIDGSPPPITVVPTDNSEGKSPTSLPVATTPVPVSHNPYGSRRESGTRNKLVSSKGAAQLERALQKNDLLEVIRLTSGDVDPEWKNEAGELLRDLANAMISSMSESLEQAITRNDSSEVLRLAKAGVNANWTNKDGKSLLYLAVKKVASERSDPQMVSILLKAGKGDPNKENEDEEKATPCHIAAVYGSVRVMLILSGLQSKL